MDFSSGVVVFASVEYIGGKKFKCIQMEINGLKYYCVGDFTMCASCRMRIARIYRVCKVQFLGFHNSLTDIWLESRSRSSTLYIDRSTLHQLMMDSYRCRHGIKKRKSSQRKYLYHETITRGTSYGGMRNVFSQNVRRWIPLEDYKGAEILLSLLKG